MHKDRIMALTMLGMATMANSTPGRRGDRMPLIGVDEAKDVDEEVTTPWAIDAEKVAAAEAKRVRKQAKRAGVRHV